MQQTRPAPGICVKRPFQFKKGGIVIETELFQQLCESHANTIYRIALNYTKNPQDAEDVTQNALLRCLRADVRFESGEHLRTWVIRVAVNESKRWLGSPWRRLLAGPVPEAGAFAPQGGLGLPERELAEALLHLPEKYRIPLYLFYYEDRTAAQIAQALGLSVSGVTTRLARGRQKLKACLEGELLNDE